MTSETLTYQGIPKECTLQKQIDLQKYILDPSSIPYEKREQRNNLVARSAGTQVENKQTLSIQKALELQKKILGDY